MPSDKQQAQATENEEYGTAGHETGIDEPAETGSAGLYATRIHEEGDEALEAGEREAESPAR
jgi:hypothetical protein